MSFPKYPEYKDSGVEWLGEMPAHWVVGPLRWYATIQGGVAKGKSYSDDMPTVDLPYLRVANVQDGHVDLSSVNTVTVALSEVDRYRLQPGDVLMNEGGDNDKLGRGSVWQGEIADCLHQNHVFAIRPNQYLLPYWLSMFTRSGAARSYFYLYSKQSTNLASISSSNVMSCPLPLPPQEEQRQVLRFLDHETARIDALVEEQKRLIELLKEKRQAVISHAVTKGLDPDVPMKDSGVEWLGEVPVHWEVKRVKHLCDLGSDSLRPGPFGSHIKGDDFIEESEFRVYNQATVISGDFSRSAYIYESKYQELVAFSVFPRDILLTSRGTIGKVAIAPDGVGRGVIHPCLIRLRLDENQIYLPYFKFFFGDTDLAVEQLRLASNSTTIDVVYAENLANLWMALPPIEEQEKIDGNIASRLRVIDSTIGTAVQQVSLLKERRSALISGAVTGKIDVRGWQVGQHAEQAEVLLAAEERAAYVYGKEPSDEV